MSINTKNTGYTLIEILVALTIIGLLFGFGFVSFRDFSRRQIVIGTADKIRGDLRLAQSQANSGQKPDDIGCTSPSVLDSFGLNVISETEYTIEAHCAGAISTTVDIKTVTLSTDLSITTPSPNPINFKVLGEGTNIPSVGTATITITQLGTSNTATVTVTGGGKIQ